MKKNNWTESKVSPATESRNNALKPLRILSLHTTDCVFTLRSNMVYCLLYFRRGNSLFWVLQCVLHTCCFTHLNTPLPPLLLLQTSVTVTYLILPPFIPFVHLCCVTFYNQSSFFLCLPLFLSVFVCSCFLSHLHSLSSSLSAPWPPPCRLPSTFSSVQACSQPHKQSIILLVNSFSSQTGNWNLFIHVTVSVLKVHLCIVGKNPPIQWLWCFSCINTAANEMTWIKMRSTLVFIHRPCIL